MSLVDRILMSKPNQPPLGVIGNYSEQDATSSNRDLVRLIENWPSGEKYYNPFIVDTDEPALKYVYKIIKTQRIANRNIYTLERKDVQYLLFGRVYEVEDSRRYLMIYDFPGLDQVLEPAPVMSNYGPLDEDIEVCDITF